MQPFSPNGPNLSLTLSSVSSGAALPGSGGEQIRVVHPTGVSTGFLAFGFGAIPVASNIDLPIMANSEEIFSLPAGCTHVAMVVGSGTPVVQIQRGTGE